MPESDAVEPGSAEPESARVTLDAVLDGGVTSGRHRLDDAVPAASVTAVAAARSWRGLVVDVEAAGAKLPLLAAFANAGRFPEWFGHNWDALADALTDLSWLPAEGYVVLLEHWGRLAATDVELGQTLMSVLDAVAREWDDRGTPFVVLVRG